MTAGAEIDVCPPVERSMHEWSDVELGLLRRPFGSLHCGCGSGLVAMGCRRDRLSHRYRSCAWIDSSLSSGYSIEEEFTQELWTSLQVGELLMIRLKVSGFLLQRLLVRAYNRLFKVLEQNGQQFIVDRSGTKDAFTINGINITYVVSLSLIPLMSFIVEPHSKLFLYPLEHNPLLLRRLLLDAIPDFRSGVGIGAGLLRTAASYLHPPLESTPSENSEDWTWLFNDSSLFNHIIKAPNFTTPSFLAHTTQ
ncbi:unnamed protein product [Taenia asiatica]|uniref:Uncharacterized protein n=1 Tax=Taenia asiatica TaxID=60517 RepID=A0A0R3W5Z8_TAEAS|nr:unnamed protein product [Taenia asiatica]